jgi:hypothetical protein
LRSATTPLIRSIVSYGIMVQIYIVLTFTQFSRTQLGRKTRTKCYVYLILPDSHAQKIVWLKSEL